MAPLAPPDYILEDNVPDILTFMGFTVYAACFFFAVTEYVEKEGGPILSEGASEYSPVYLLLGLLMGLVSYGLALFGDLDLNTHWHSACTTVAFVLFAKHLTRRAELSGRRSSTIIMVGALPLLCLAVLEAGTVKVRSARFFFALMIVFSFMPLPALFREWLPGTAGPLACDGHSAKIRKRLFALFFFAFCFVFASTPMHSQHRPSKGDARQSVVVFFDLAMVYYSLDGLWTRSAEQHPIF